MVFTFLQILCIREDAFFPFTIECLLVLLNFGYHSLMILLNHAVLTKAHCIFFLVTALFCNIVRHLLTLLGFNPMFPCPCGSVLNRSTTFSADEHTQLDGGR